jgi:hypothetical protein
VPTGPDGAEVADVPSPLAGVRYGERALDLVRFADDPLDDTIARVVNDAAHFTNPRREAVRAAINEEDAHTLLLFARRRAVAALRTRLLPLAVEAVRGLTLVTRSRIDYRDLDVDFPLFAARELGGNLDELIRDAVGASDNSTGEYFTARSRAAHRVSLKDCALLEVRSSYGLGYMHTWSQYHPRTNLALAAVRLADQVDNDGRYLIEDMHTSDLPEVWFTLGARTGQLPTKGCVSLSAKLCGANRWSHGLLVFLAEVARSRIAAELAARASTASTADRPRAATSVDRRVALIIGGSSTYEEDAVETAESLARFRDLAVAALIGDDF